MATAWGRVSLSLESLEAVVGGRVIHRAVGLFVEDVGESVVDFKLLEHGTEPARARLLGRMSQTKKKGTQLVQQKNIPVATNLGNELFLELLEIERRQLGEPWVDEDAGPSHDRRNLSV